MKASNFNTLYGHCLLFFSDLSFYACSASGLCNEKSLCSPKTSMSERSGKVQQKRRQIRMEGGVRRGMSTHLRGPFDI